MGLWYSKDSGFELIAYADADHAGCNNDCKSTTGGIQFLGDKLVSWSSKKQDCTTISSAKAEFRSTVTQKVQLPYLAISYNIQEQNTLTSAIISSKSMLRKSIPCSPECKIVGLILLDHCLSHALTATVDVPAVDTLHLPVETPEIPFVAPANIHTIEAFMNRVGYQGVVDKVSDFFTKNLAQPWQTLFKVFNRCLTTRTSGHDQTKINILQLFHVEAIQYPCFIKLIVADLMKKFPDIPKRLEEDYYSIKDDVPLVSVYTTGNVSIRGMLVLDVFLTAEIRETNDFKEYETVFIKVDVPMNQPQPVVSTQGIHRITPSAHREKKDDEMGSLEIRNEETQITIPTLLSPPRKILSSDKKTFQELTDIISNPTISTSKQPQETHNKTDDILHEVVPQIAENVTNDLIEANLKPCIVNTIIEDQCDAWEEENVVEEDKVILKDVTLFAESQNIDKHVPTIFDHARMEATLRYSLSNLSRNAKEYAYHLEQSTRFMENQIVWESKQQDIPRTIPKTLIFYGPKRNPNEPPRPLYNKDLFFLKYGNTEEKKYILSLHNIHAEEFIEPDLEEKLNRWVRKFNTFNEDARITEVVRIITDQPHGLDFMEKILMMRDNDKPDSFSEADFKYLNKNDIEDLYYLCRSKEFDNRKVKLMNSLITFIRSCVIWERVHDFQLGIESYQMKVNLTAPTLTFPGIKEHVT
ncbi:hypothetical protein Tco_0057701 [Tanacetum coccineum]